MTNEHRDAELAVQMVAARLARDDDTIRRIARDHPHIADKLLGFACALALQLAREYGVSVTHLMDELLMEAATQTTRGEES